MRSALEILAREARRRGTTYGKFVASTPEVELGADRTPGPAER